MVSGTDEEEEEEEDGDIILSNSLPVPFGYLLLEGNDLKFKLQKHPMCHGQCPYRNVR